MLPDADKLDRDKRHDPGDYCTCSEPVNVEPHGDVWQCLDCGGVVPVKWTLRPGEVKWKGPLPFPFR